MTTTDYTEKKTENTLCGTHLSRYRLGHWLIDILKNFLSDPVNIYDERIRKILMIQDGVDPNDCYALFKVEPPYTMDSRKAGTTPAILVNTTESKYPIVPLNGVGATLGAINAQQMYRRSVARSMGATIAIVTESCDGTALLTDIIEEFLVRNSLLFPLDGMIGTFSVTGSSAVQRIPAGNAINAKDWYQAVIQVEVTGGLTWTTDTQGPVYRGLTNKMN